MLYLEVCDIEALEARMCYRQEGRRLRIQRADIRYFRFPETWALRGRVADYRFVMLVQRDADCLDHWFDDDGVSHAQPERVDRVVGMAQLQVNPDDADEIWLSFVEVSEDFRRQGHAKTLSKAVIALLQSPWGVGKRLKRSTPSEMGAAYLKDALTGMLDEVQIPWSFSRDA